MNYLNLSAKKTAHLISTGKIDPVELIEFHLERAEQYNSKINALTFINRKSAIAQAKACRKNVRAKNAKGKLLGVPFTVKDHFPVKGLPYSDGNVDSFVKSATHTARAVELLQAEGAICIGKGNMTEYGKGYITDNDLYGCTNNPFNLAHTPGGSSGGDAASLAAGFAKFALAGDAGGSIRVPAGYCGLFGLFTTNGSVTRMGSALPVGVKSLMSAYGPMACTLEDIALTFEILSGYEASDFSSLAAPRELPVFKKKRFAFYSRINNVDCDNQIAQFLLSTTRQLLKIGYKAKESTPPPIAQANPYFIVLAGPTALAQEDMQAKLAGKPRNLERESFVLKRLRERIKNEAPPLTAELVLLAWTKMHELRHSIYKLFDEFDFILAPVSATLPPKHGVALYNVNGKDFQSQEVYQFASAINLLGLTSLAFPVGLSKEGLPIGLQIIGPRFSEPRLIEVVKRLGFQDSIKPEI